MSSSPTPPKPGVVFFSGHILLVMPGGAPPAAHTRVREPETPRDGGGLPSPREMKFSNNGNGRVPDPASQASDRGPDP